MPGIFDIIKIIIISFAFGLFAFFMATNIPLLRRSFVACLAVGVIYFIAFAIAWIFEIYVVMLVLFILFTLVYVLWLLISWLKRL